MKITLIISILSLLGGWGIGGESEASRVKHFNVKKAVAIEGYDPVSYFDRKPEQGKPEYTFTYKGIMYRFGNQQNLNKFKATPDAFEPAYGGWCAYAMGVAGEKVKIDPHTYKILDGKLFLFYNFKGTNTLNDWNQDEKKLKASADQYWKKIMQ